MKLNRILSRFSCLLPALSMLTLNTALAEETQKPPEAPTAYVTPAEFTRDDKQMLAEYSSRYDYCLGEKSVEQMQRMDDPRHIVDFAMKSCAVELENMNREMAARNFDPDFRKAYIKRVSNRSVNSTLRIVMMGMANKEAQSQAER